MSGHDLPEAAQGLVDEADRHELVRRLHEEHECGNAEDDLGRDERHVHDGIDGYAHPPRHLRDGDGKSGSEDAGDDRGSKGDDEAIPEGLRDRLVRERLAEPLGRETLPVEHLASAVERVDDDDDDRRVEKEIDDERVRLEQSLTHRTVPLAKQDARR
jgi:hypothetical protein